MPDTLWCALIELIICNLSVSHVTLLMWQRMWTSTTEIRVAISETIAGGFTYHHVNWYHFQAAVNRLQHKLSYNGSLIFVYKYVCVHWPIELRHSCIEFLDLLHCCSPVAEPSLLSPPLFLPSLADHCQLSIIRGHVLLCVCDKLGEVGMVWAIMCVSRLWGTRLLPSLRGLVWFTTHTHTHTHTHTQCYCRQGCKPWYRQSKSSHLQRLRVTLEYTSPFILCN